MPLLANDWVSGFTTMTTRSNNLIILAFTVFSISAKAQLLDLYPHRSLNLDEPVEVYKIGGDSLVSSFIIYVNTQVRAHYHAEHSEHVMVLESQGSMILEDSIFTINPGDFIFIPRGAVHSVYKISEAPLKVISIQAPYFDGNDRFLFPPKR